MLAVLVLRLFLRKTPKWITCLLWCIVALRLVMPFTLESPLSLIPSAEVVPQDIVTSAEPAIHSDIPVVNRTVNPIVTQQTVQEKDTLQDVLSIVSVVWAAGAGLMVLYGISSVLVLRHRVRVSVPLRENVYECDNVDSPFVFGFFRPQIYIPSGMAEEHISYVLAHEKSHIHRGDHCWKPLGFWLLSVYWFHPLLWFAYILLCRDIESACDEKVIAQMDDGDKKGYSQALVSCSVHRRMIMACPVAFGETDVKRRIKGILNYKKPGFWVIAGAILVCIVTAVCFLTNPKACIHNYSSEITLAATCTEKGMETRTCSLCQHVYTVPVDVAPHSYSSEITIAATCTEKGVETRTCTACRHSYTVEIPICPHSFDNGVVTSAPTCVQQGLLEYTCIDCGAQKTEILATTVHTDGAHTVSKAPTCSQKGEATTACTVCGAVYVVGVLPENDVHNWEETVIRKATCTDAGEGVKTCTWCNASEKVTYALLEHNFRKGITDPGSCIHRGFTSWWCVDCGYDHIEYTQYGTHCGSYRCLYCGEKITDPFEEWVKSRSDYGKPGIEKASPGVSGIPTLPEILWDLNAPGRQGG